MENLIAAEEFCAIHQVEFTFINSLQEFELIEMTIIEEKPFIPLTQLQKIEKMIRLHYDLHINLEGIDAITHLLDKTDSLYHEITLLRNRLRLYES